MTMKYKSVWLAILIASTLNLSGCNEDLQPGEGPNTPTDPIIPPDPIDPTDPTDPTDPSDFVGTWVNKDEDGDGVPDELDDYPFDASKSKYPLFIEQEPNDNPSVATVIAFTAGVRVQGVISSELDKGDLFKFEVAERRSLTAIFKTPSSRFQPQVYVSNADGLVIDAIFLYKYAAPNIYVVNFPLYEPGTYQLSVIDENFAGGPDLSYEIIFFNDEDVDSFDDIKERAFASNLIKNDMDEDKVLDGLEYLFGLDTDGDNLPNWTDEDADGDTFSDILEGDSDIDGDGIPNFLDRDSDGNNLDDQLESGSANSPLDFDDDNIIDHLDIDDDNDGIFDVNDLQRLSPAKVQLWQKPGDLFIETIATLYEDTKVKYFVRSGDKFEIEVDGYPSSSNSPILVVNIQGKLFNLHPITTRTDDGLTYLSFLMPTVKGSGEVSLAIGQVKSESYPIEVGSADLPLLKVNNVKEVTAGDVITLQGDNFDDDTLVFFNSIPAVTQYLNRHELRLTVPEGITGGSYSVNNSVGKSNYITFIVQQNIQVNVDAPNAKKITAIGGIYPELALPLSSDNYTIQKMGTSAEVVFTYTNNGYELVSYLSAIHYIGDTNLEFSYRSTALANMVLQLNYYLEPRGLNTKQIAQFIEKTSVYEEYVSEVEAHLTESSDFFSFKNRSDETVKFLANYEARMLKELTSIQKSPPTSRSQVNPSNYTLNDRNNSVLSALEPTIVSYPETVGTWNAFDMTMEATTFLENQGELANNCGEGVDPKWYQVLNLDGCIELKNRSQLYLSARVYALDPKTGLMKQDLASLNSPIENHVSQPWDNAMLGPITGTFLGVDVWSSDSLIDKCVYKDCLYQIVTPGVDGVFGPSPYQFNGTEDYNIKANKARQYLAIRTIIDNIVIRFYSILFDAAGIDLDAPEHRSKDKVLKIIKAVYTGVPSIGQEVAKILSKDTITEADWTNLASAIGQGLYESEIKKVLSNPLDLGSYGPVTKAILSTLEITPEQFALKIAQKVAEKFIPGWGQVTAAYEASTLASSMIDMVATIKDLIVVPTKLDFLVTWGLKASDITPRMIQKTGQTKGFTIVGSGMAKIPSSLGFPPTPPQVRVYDLGNSEKELSAKVSDVNTQGTELTFYLQYMSEIEAAVGPLKVEVEHLDKIATVPYDILIGNDLTIADITPAKASAGEEVVITGVGFSRSVSGNQVTFSGANGQRLTAPVKSASTDSLTVVLPSGVASGYVTVEVAGGLSNEYPFSGPGSVLITFGDNGNLNDDVFKLSVDNRVVYDNNQPERKVGPLTVALDDGDHTVKLTGIRADDGIATYYIEFAGDVISVSGDELSGRDLCPNTHKTYQLTVKSGSNVVSKSKSKLSVPLVLLNESATEPTECPTTGN